MSYSSRLKEELVHHSKGSLAELAGFAHATGVIHLRGKGLIALSVSSEINSVIRHFYSILKNHWDREFSIEKKQEINSRYHLFIEDASDIAERLGIVEKDSLNYRDDISEEFLRSERDKRDFLSGVFLGSGIVSDPASSYHLEMNFNHDAFMQTVKKLLDQHELEALVTQRKNKHVLYFKKSEAIMEFIYIIGASGFALNYENTRIINSLRGDVNRQVNCETANISKTVEASKRHVECIEYIQNKRGLKSLSDSLQEIARLRWEEPELTLKELGERLDPPLSKSGVNHRLNRLLKICSEMRKQ